MLKHFFYPDQGEKIVTNLVPYGPEKPRSGMVRSSATRQVMIRP